MFFMIIVTYVIGIIGTLFLLLIRLTPTRSDDTGSEILDLALIWPVGFPVGLKILILRRLQDKAHYDMIYGDIILLIFYYLLFPLEVYLMIK
jgi:hypothetical protein